MASWWHETVKRKQLVLSIETKVEILKRLDEDCIVDDLWHKKKEKNL